jgi:predicted DNA-binding transcriptional regulator YafY
MARGDQLVRQWRLVKLLVETREGLSVVQLSRALGTTIRTVYRDLEILERADFPLTSIRRGKWSFWKIVLLGGGK